jgi:MoaA/NifB/PqqE/SkfB family radical SAM enzyme
VGGPVLSPAGPAATCRAPHVNLRFSPDGSIVACCANGTYVLGHVARDRVLDVWRGERLARLRAALDAGDWSLGCQDCGAAAVLGDRTQTPAEDFDRFAHPTAAPDWPVRLEFALSNTCNLQCIHCSGELSSAIRAQREHRPPLPPAYDDAFFAQLPELLAHAEVVTFIGGEPFLAREARRVWDLLLELGVRPEVDVTTNATVWDERVERYVRELGMHVAVSVDGATAATNDAIRLGSSLDAVLANRDRFLAAVRAGGGAFCINFCLMRQNWHELHDVLREGDRLDVPVHVIPVHSPAATSLFALPGADLRAVVEHLDRRGRRRRLRRNRRAWDGVVAYLRHHLAGVEAAEAHARAEAEAAVVIRRPTTVALDRVRADLTAWAGQPAAVLRTDDGRLTGVEAPPWTVALALDDLVGRSVEDVAAVMDEHLGPIVELTEVDEPDGTTVVDHARRHGDRVVRYRTVLGDWGMVTATPVAVEAPGADG